MIVFDKEQIDNANMAMIFSLDSMNRMLNRQYVIEDGRITEIHIENRIITGGNKNVI